MTLPMSFPTAQILPKKLFLISFIIPALLSAVLLLGHLNPSPWLSTTLPLFLRLPPRLDAHHGSTPPVPGCQDLSITTLEPREKAAIVLLLREGDLEEVLATLDNFERKFNRNFRYPYVFIGSPDVPDFSPEFKNAIAELLPVGAETEWATVPLKDWSIPKPMDAAKTREGFAKMEKDGVQYGGREGYHHMIRFFSGPWARQNVLEKYDWYWRLEPGVRFFCSITYDPFRFMAIHNKIYGFVITIVENANTIPTLFNTLQKYRQRKQLTPGTKLWDFMVEEKNGKEEYNLCHFWTNFEIGDLRFFRGNEYQFLFRELDAAGGFYTERWGDAPIRSLALGLLADTDQVHYFEDIGYKHDSFVHCPKDREVGCQCKCPNYGEGFIDIDNTDWYTCLPKWSAAVHRSISK